jgi:hypothetical protein
LAGRIAHAAVSPHSACTSIWLIRVIAYFASHFGLYSTSLSRFHFLAVKMPGFTPRSATQRHVSRESSCSQPF